MGCVVGFVCSGIAAMTLIFGLIGLLVASGAMTSFFPCRGWTCTVNYEAFNVCLGKIDGTAGPSYASFAFGVITAGVWLGLAVCGCKLYNLFAPDETDGVPGTVVVPANTQAVL